MEAFKQLKKHAVVVYINTKKRAASENLSPLVLGVINANSMGNIIPKVVVTSHNQKSYIASMPYKSMKDKKSFRAVNAQIKEALAGKAMEKPKDAKIVWTLAGSGRYYKGDFVEIKDDKDLVLKSPEGKNFSVPLEKLTKGTQAYARALAGGGAEPAASKKPELESWTNKKGKQIHARFLSLKNGKISLEKMDGKVVTFNVSVLSEESQKRAKELAGQ